MEYKKVSSSADREQIQRRILSHIEMEEREQSIQAGKSIMRTVQKRRFYYSVGSHRSQNSEKCM